MVSHFLMADGMLFHRVAAAFRRLLWPFITSRIFRTVISDSDLRDLVGRYWTICSTDGQSHLVFYKHTRVSYTSTCIYLEASAGSSRLALCAVVFWHESPLELQTAMIFVGGHAREHCYSPAFVLSAQGRRFCKALQCIHHLLHDEWCIKVYSKVLYSCVSPSK